MARPGGPTLVTGSCRSRTDAGRIQLAGWLASSLASWGRRVRGGDEEQPAARAVRFALSSTVGQGFQFASEAAIMPWGAAGLSGAVSRRRCTNLHGPGAGRLGGQRRGVERRDGVGTGLFEPSGIEQLARAGPGELALSTAQVGQEVQPVARLCCLARLVNVGTVREQRAGDR